MPYIGKQPLGGAYHKLDALTASATDTYALTLGSAAYYPGTANQLLVSLNGVIQAPQDSFTVSGSNLVFDSALTSNDSIDFVVAFGDVLDINTPSDGAITTVKLGNNAVTDTKLATSLDLSNKTLTMPTGSVLKVKSTINDLSLNNTAEVSTQTDTGIAAIDMTRTQTSSKFLISLNGGRYIVGYTSGYATYFYAKEGSGSYANVNDGTGYEQAVEFNYSNDPSNNNQGSHSAQFLYTPTSSTDDCSFKVYYTRFGNNSTQTAFNRHDNVAGSSLCFTIMEIAG